MKIMHRLAFRRASPRAVLVYLALAATLTVVAALGSTGSSRPT